jgi:hypothetical protein
VKPILFISLLAIGLPTLGRAGSLDQVPRLFKMVETYAKNPATPNASCSFIPEFPNRFTSRDEFQAIVCRNLGTIPLDSLIEKLRHSDGPEAVAKFSSGEMNFDQFVAGFKFFVANNSTLESRYGGMHRDEWTLHTYSPIERCRFSTAYDKPVPILQSMNFKNLPFVGLSHMASLSEPERKLQQKELLSRLEKQHPDALLLEGYAFGQPLPCEQVLKSVFTPYEEMRDEGGLLQKYAFLHRVSLIPADNQTVTEATLRDFYANDLEKGQQLKTDLQFVDVLHFYYSALQKKSAKPLEEAISIARQAEGVPLDFDPQKFKMRYKELNGHDLPEDENSIFHDIAPSSFLESPNGTNRLVDAQQDLRNRSLLRAIQISMKKYSAPVVFYGSGHLAELGIDLEKYIGKAVNVDLKDRCH